MKNKIFVILSLTLFFTAIGMYLASKYIYQLPLFFRDFLPNFFSDLIVGILIAGLVTWASQYLLQKPKAQITYAINPLEKNYNIKFFIHNIGNTVFKKEELAWHILIDKNISFKKISSAPLIADVFPIEPMTYLRYSDINYNHLYQTRYMLIFEIEISPSATINQNSFRYFLSTIHGLLPSNMKFDKQGIINVFTIPPIENFKKEIKQS